MDMHPLSEISLTSHSQNKTSQTETLCVGASLLLFKVFLKCRELTPETYVSAAILSVWKQCKLRRCSKGNECRTGRGVHLVMRFSTAPSLVTSGDKMSPYSGLALRQHHHSATRTAEPHRSLLLSRAVPFSSIGGVFRDMQGCPGVSSTTRVQLNRPFPLQFSKCCVYHIRFRQWTRATWYSH